MATVARTIGERERRSLEGCFHLLWQQCDALLTEIEYEEGIGFYSPLAAATAKCRIETLAEMLLDGFEKELLLLSFVGEVDRWRAWLRRALASRSQPEPSGTDELFPAGRPVAEVRWQVRQWIRRLDDAIRNGAFKDRNTATRCFVSYCAESDLHIDWVQRVAETLQSMYGIRIMIDLWDLLPADDLSQFMEQGISQSDCVLVVCTPEYKRRADDRSRGVGQESSIITRHRYRSSLGGKRVIPALRGQYNESWPEFLGDVVYVDCRDGRSFEEIVKELAKAVERIPRVPRPPIGTSPFSYDRGWDAG